MIDANTARSALKALADKASARIDIDSKAVLTRMAGKWTGAGVDKSIEEAELDGADRNLMKQMIASQVGLGGSEY